MNKLLGTLIVSMVVLIPTPPLAAQIPCLSTERMERVMEERFKEELIIVGQTGNGSQLRLYASDSTHEWTLIIVGPDGKACYMMDGTDLDTVKQEMRGPTISLTPEVTEMFKKLLGVDV